jgi:hypothetical protein
MHRQEVPERRCDVGSREKRGGYLIEQGLKEVVVRAVDERDAHGCTAENPRRREPAETAAENDDVGAFCDRSHREFIVSQPRACKSKPPRRESGNELDLP